MDTWPCRTLNALTVEWTYPYGVFGDEPGLMCEIFVDSVQAPHLGTGLVQTEDPVQSRVVLLRFAERAKFHLVDCSQSWAEMSGGTLELRVFPWHILLWEKDVWERKQLFTAPFLWSWSLMIVIRCASQSLFRTAIIKCWVNLRPGFPFCSS